MEWVSGNKRERTRIDWKHGRVALYVAKLRGSPDGNELECVDAVEYDAPGPSKKFTRFRKITPTACEFSEPSDLFHFPPPNHDFTRLNTSEPCLSTTAHHPDSGFFTLGFIARCQWYVQKFLSIKSDIRRSCILPSAPTAVHRHPNILTCLIRVFCQQVSGPPSTRSSCRHSR